MISTYKQLEFLLQFGTLAKSKTFYQFTPHTKYLELFGYMPEEIESGGIVPFNYANLENLITRCFDAAIKNHQRKQQPI
jgi:hypothetical protein